MRESLLQEEDKDRRLKTDENQQWGKRENPKIMTNDWKREETRQSGTV